MGYNGNGKAVILIDFNTGEYIGEYRSYMECASDLGISEDIIRHFFDKRSSYCCIGKSKKYDLAIMRKDAYLNLLNTVPKGDLNKC